MKLVNAFRKGGVLIDEEGNMCPDAPPKLRDLDTIVTHTRRKGRVGRTARGRTIDTVLICSAGRQWNGEARAVDFSNTFDVKESSAST